MVAIAPVVVAITASDFRFKRMIIWDVGAIAARINLGNSQIAEKLTKSRFLVLKESFSILIQNSEFCILLQFPQELIEKQKNDLYNLDSQVNFAYFKISGFSRKNTPSKKMPNCHCE
ncbi:hypothetical protein CK516_18980 [Nostoc sp. 'Peltigera malacea cyanobiont' DB3992]|nr:hypothetical protein CK516_18980 [Nostoc sp. 'Peltigera malacea cyanobiont' DB3992]